MLDFLGEKNGRPESKILTTTGMLPSYIDRSQPPTKKLPWRAINDVGFVKCVEMVLPEELYDIIWTKVEQDLKPVQYARVIMRLEDVLDGAFFTEYIKKGRPMRSFSFVCKNRASWFECPLHAPQLHKRPAVG